MKSRDLQRHYWDWLSTGERLLRSLSEQSIALTRRDIGRVELLQPELDRLAERMSEIDKTAAEATKKLAGALGTEPKLRSIVASLKESEAQQLNALAERVRVVAQNLENSAAHNRRLMTSELEYISGTVALISQAVRDEQREYAPPAMDAPVLVNQVA